MSKSKKKETQSYDNHTSVDTQTQAYQQAIRNAAEQSGNAGPSPLTTAAAGYNTGLQGAGTLGVNALSGDQAATQQLMNPYQQQVIDANNRQWQHTNQQSLNALNDHFTKAGAFGGSRQGVASGTALAQNNMTQQGQTAGLLQGGYSDAMNRAEQLAGMGYAGAQSNANLGLGGVGSPQQWLMQQLKAGYLGPMGQNTTGGSVGNQSTTGMDWMKAAGAVAGMFGGGGGG